VVLASIEAVEIAVTIGIEPGLQALAEMKDRGLMTARELAAERKELVQLI
jgi:hypothetical protein